MNTTPETEDLARIALGRGGHRNNRVRRALIARLLSEQGEGDEEVGADVGGDGADEDEERQLVRVLVGGRLLKRRRLRRMLKAKLVTARGQGADSDESEDDSDEDDRELARLLVGHRMLRRRRVRRALLAHIVRETAGGDEESEESDDDLEDAGDGEGAFIRLVIGSRALKRRRVRRAVLAHLVKERAEAGDESDEGEDTDDGRPDLEREVARLLIGGRAIRRRRTRRDLARYLRASGDAG